MATFDAVVSWLLNRRRKILRYAFIPRGIVGIVLLLFGAYSGRTQCQLLFAGTRTTGTIIGYETRELSTRGSSHRGSYRHRSVHTGFMPIVEFTVDGNVVRFTNWWGSRTTPNSAERVSVLYDSANPSTAMIDRGLLDWVPWAPVFMVGVLLIASTLRAWLAFVRG